MYKICLYAQLFNSKFYNEKPSFSSIIYHVKELLSNIIHSKDTNALETTLKKNKAHSKLTTIVAVWETFPQYEYKDDIKIIKLLNSKSSKVSDSVIPLQHLIYLRDNNINEYNHTFDKIDIFYILKTFITQLKQTYKPEEEFEDNKMISNHFQEYIEDNDDIPIVIQTGKKYSYSSKGLYDLFDYINKPTIRDYKQIGEVFLENKAYWLFIEIETSDKNITIPINNIIEHIVANLQILASKAGIIIQTNLLQCSSGLNKFRLYTNLAMTIKQMKFVVNNIKQHCKDCWKFIDGQPYNINHSLWLPMSYKFNDADELIKWCYITTKDKFPNYVINFTENCTVLENSIIFNINNFYNIQEKSKINKPIKQLQVILADLFNIDEHSINITSNDSNSNYQVHYSKGVVRKCFIDKNQTHTSNGGVIFKKSNNLYYQCFADSCKNSILDNKFIALDDVLIDDKQNDKFDYIENIINNSDFKINNLPPTHNQPFLTKIKENDTFDTIEFNNIYLNKHIYIVSPMGTGKTNLIQHYLDN